MRPWLELTLLLILLGGCHSRPIKVETSGGMNFGGKMAMTGDVSSSIKQDNTASPLHRVAVSGNPASPCSIAILDVDDFFINRNLTGLGSIGGKTRGTFS